MFESIQNTFKIPELRKKIFITLGLLVVFRVGAHIPIPGVDVTVIKEFVEKMEVSGFQRMLGLFNIFSGGSLARCALFSLGIMPYISASIIFQLLVKVVPQLEELSKEGPAGQRKISQYTRIATVPLCLIQSFMLLKLITARIGGGMYIVPPEEQTILWRLIAILSFTTGTMFLMWLGEQISEYGVGSGISLIIMAGIISKMPGALIYMIGLKDQIGLEKIFIIIALFIIMVVVVVLITQGQRRIPIQQAKHTRGRRIYGGQRQYLPLRVNQAGVIPVIFASSLLIFPSALAKWLELDIIDRALSPGKFWYIGIYVTLTIFFCYFWTNLMFQPAEMAKNLKEYGSFIPGIRPGKRTAEYLERMMNRVTLVGGGFLAFIAIFPQIVSETMGVSRYFTAFLGGTGILIVVGVALDLVQKIESHLLMRHYDGFLGSSGRKLRGRR